MVERQQPCPDARHPVDVQQVPPDRARRLGRVAHGLDDVDRPRLDATIERHAHPVERVRGGATLKLDDHALQLAASLAAPRRVGERAGLPPGRSSREHAGGLGRDPVVHWRHERLGLLERHDPRLSRRLEPRVVGRPLTREIDLPRERGDAIAEAAVDRVLRGPEARDGLAARAAGVELRPHHRL